jgi:hypothetical protein
MPREEKVKGFIILLAQQQKLNYAIQSTLTEK